VVDGGMKMVINLSGFDVGEKLVLSVDVDEAQFVDPDTGDIDVNAVAEGGEWQRSHFYATFTAPHYYDITTHTQYWDEFDENFAAIEKQTGTHLNLPNDHYDGPVDLADFTAGAVAKATQVPLPSSLSGVVFVDMNLNNKQDNGEQGLGNTSVTLYLFNGTQYVSTGKTTVTDTQGNYKFDNLAPGTYRVVETQPVGYFSVGAQAGKVNGQTRGTVTTSDIVSGVELLGGEDSIHNDFAEALPNSIAGHIHLDKDGDCMLDPGEPPLADVVVHLLNAQGQVIATTKTDQNGNYKFENLAPGTYGVVEEQPAGYFNGGNEVGTAGGVLGTDTVTQIVLTSGIHGMHYDFCELEPSSLSGYVHVDQDGDCMFDPGEPPLAGVVIHLLNGNGQIVGTTTTNAQGYYEFDNLAPGTYGVIEEQPAGYFNGGNEVGSAGGILGVDTVTQIDLLPGIDGVHYDFCEVEPASISGYVHIDKDGDCMFDEGEPPLAGVVIQLLDANNSVVATTTTNAEGFYKFADLEPGTYGVREIQPVGYFNGGNEVGSAGGTLGVDIVTQVTLGGGVDGVHYDFCEVEPVGISGYVRIDTTGDCTNDPTAPPLAGVTIQLLDSTGKIIGTTITDVAGYYSFDGLPPGTYSVHEVQPAGYFNGGTFAGSEGGVAGNDLISNVVLLSGVHGVQYNFCEMPPANLCGYVYVDMNNNGIREPGEAGIGGVRLELLDAGGNATGMTTVTDTAGRYCFMGLMHGTYRVRETQPTEYFDGLDTPGTNGGVAQNPGDLIRDIMLMPGDDADNYNFGELPPATISGNVNARYGESCDIEDGATPISGVVIHLRDGQGNLVATTRTNSSGFYQFTHLAPGTYTVIEEQPLGYFQGDADPGSEGGDALTSDIIGNVTLGGGVNGVHYDFCEIPPASLSGYVFQDGPPISVTDASQPIYVPDYRDGQLTPDDTRLANVTLMLVDGVTGLPIMGSVAMSGTYAADQAITVTTDGSGYYEFVGLPPGTYGVYLVSPEGYIPGIDTAGTLGGFVISTWTVTDPTVLDQLVAPPEDDGIVGVGLLANYHSEFNNFSVVLVTTGVQVFVFPPPPAPEPPPLVPLALLAEPPLYALPPWQYPLLTPNVLTRTGGQLYTWHLSVVDAGLPRSIASPESQMVLASAVEAEQVSWEGSDMAEGEWTLVPNTASGPGTPRKLRFGVKGGIPVAGDFDGNGTFETGIFKEGRWFIDLNANGVWDQGDLWAKLGRRGDRPVTGDWDGDGKTDIGIYGPAWPRDPRAIKHEPGMPDPHNVNSDVLKNIPREKERNAVGKRELRLTSQGKKREDLIDHVFLYGLAGDQPIVGDWNGDGVDTIAVFRDGRWHRDTDGDGKWTNSDSKSGFGQVGDKPVIGDFNGDGIDELGVYRDGTWHIDTNGNFMIDDQDQVFHLGTAGDKPVVGDWDGDGRADPGVYSEAAPASRTAGK
jgi:protocatechuate 3,4-dioxygenase beta subunit